MKINQLTESERKVAVLLIRYMQKNPDAKHTAEGIARWWIMQQRFDEELKAVEKVIEYLADTGVLEKAVLPDGNTYYKFRPEKRVYNFRI